MSQEIEAYRYQRMRNPVTQGLDHATFDTHTTRRYYQQIRSTTDIGQTDNARSLGGKIVKVVAGQGKDAITLQIHQDVLSRNSEFFKRIIKPEWAELRDDPDTIDMGPTHSADEVRSYAHWLYSGTIPTRDFDHKHGTKSDPIWIDLVSIP